MEYRLSGVWLVLFALCLIDMGFTLYGVHYKGYTLELNEFVILVWNSCGLIIGSYLIMVGKYLLLLLGQYADLKHRDRVFTIVLTRIGVLAYGLVLLLHTSQLIKFITEDSII
jgi:hypothetical protein